MPRPRKEIVYPNTKWVGIHLPLEFDRQIKLIQEKFEDAGKTKPSKADLIVELTAKGLECSDYDEFVKLQFEIFETNVA